MPIQTKPRVVIIGDTAKLAEALAEIWAEALREKNEALSHPDESQRLLFSPIQK